MLIMLTMPETTKITEVSKKTQINMLYGDLSRWMDHGLQSNFPKKIRVVSVAHPRLLTGYGAVA